MNKFAWFLATYPDPSVHDGAEAVSWALRAVGEEPGNDEYVDTLAAAYARDGQFDEAARVQQEALELLAVKGEEVRKDREEGYQERLNQYRAGLPYTKEE